MRGVLGAAVAAVWRCSACSGWLPSAPASPSRSADSPLRVSTIAQGCGQWGKGRNHPCSQLPWRATSQLPRCGAAPPPGPAAQVLTQCLRRRADVPSYSFVPGCLRRGSAGPGLRRAHVFHQSSSNSTSARISRLLVWDLSWRWKGSMKRCRRAETRRAVRNACPTLASSWQLPPSKWVAAFSASAGFYMLQPSHT